MARSRNFEADYDEIFLETCEDKDTPEELLSLIDSAINFERTREPFEKDPSCAIMYVSLSFDAI